MKRKRGSIVTVRVTKQNSATRGKTDWERLRNMPDSEIHFTSDAPETFPEHWANAIAHRGLPVPFRKKQIALRVDEDVLEWFKAQGPGYQTRMNAVLREYRNAHRKLAGSRRSK